MNKLCFCLERSYQQRLGKQDSDEQGDNFFISCSDSNSGSNRLTTAAEVILVVSGEILVKFPFKRSGIWFKINCRFHTSPD